HAAAPASVSPPLGESSPPEDDNDEARTETKPKKLKRKKKKSDHTTLVIVVSLGVVLGLALVGGGGFAVWYFLSRKSPDRAAAEMLEIMEAFAGALEKLKEPGQRAQGTADLDGVTQRLEAWIEKYKDLEISESERQRLEAKYGDRAKQIAERIGKVFLTLLLDPQVMQDPRVTSAYGRFMQSVQRIPKTIKTEVAPPGWQKPAPNIPGPRPFQPKPVSPSPPR
ncbi:MAG: hypothetical protein NZM42_14825, partial [Gemmatales bacterium]|nr:hypothetical protein [Gemmatales bacterium]